MLSNRRIVERYVLDAVFPYLGLSLLLLTAALLTQQVARFAEILGGARAPFRLGLELLGRLLPSTLVFTLPAATLVGVIIGLSRMGNDSETVALHAAGVGRAQIAKPILLLGLALGALTFYVSFFVAPQSAQSLRRIATEAALRRFESPIEPRTFYTEVPGMILFMREGNFEKGEWGRVFIFWTDKDGTVRLVTAKSGRLDATGVQVELVLSDAEVITLPEFPPLPAGDERPITVEKSSLLRMRDERLDEGRKALIKKINSEERSPDEMVWGELLTRMEEHSASSKGYSNIAAAFHRRLALCFAPFVFSLFGAGLGLKTKRGGKGLGLMLSILTLLSYYLVAVGGENLARSGLLPTFIGIWLANILIFPVGLLLFIVKRPWMSHVAERLTRKGPAKRGLITESRRARLGWGQMDRLILRSLCWSFGVALLLLVTVFITFTLFDLLRFINSSDSSSARLMVRYLFFLLPYAGHTLAPMSLLAGILATYALMARRSEVIAWSASGQSAYRLILPGLFFAFLIGGGMWGVQEEVLPHSNLWQNALRAQIKGGTQAGTSPGKQWLTVADMRRIYTYSFDDTSANLSAPVLFEFDEGGVHLRRIIRGTQGERSGSGGIQLGDSIIIEIGETGPYLRTDAPSRPDPFEMFKPTLNKPEEKTFKQLSEDLKRAEVRNDVSAPALEMSLQRKLSEPLAPPILALIGMPLALLFGRRSAIAALCGAVLIGLSYWATISSFYYLGVKGGLPATFAAWMPLGVFAVLGIYLLARSRT